MRERVFCFFLELINLFLVALGLHWCEWAFSSYGEQGLLSSCGMKAFIAVASLVAEHRLWSMWAQ